MYGERIDYKSRILSLMGLHCLRFQGDGSHHHDHHHRTSGRVAGTADDIKSSLVQAQKESLRRTGQAQQQQQSHSTRSGNPIKGNAAPNSSSLRRSSSTRTDETGINQSQALTAELAVSVLKSKKEDVESLDTLMAIASQVSSDGGDDHHRP